MFQTALEMLNISLSKLCDEGSAIDWLAVIFNYYIWLRKPAKTALASLFLKSY